LKKARKNYTPEEKVAILRKHLVEKETVSELCDRLWMTHVKTSPYYPQSNGKIERWHKSIKAECIRPGVPLSLEDAQRIVGLWVNHYNTVRLHSAIGYIAPLDKLEGRETQIFAERDRKLDAARQQRQLRRNNDMAVAPPSGRESLATVD